MSRPNTRPPRLSSPAEIQAFQTTCERLAGFDAQLDAEFVDGYLAALATGAVLPDAAVWVPGMCDDAFERAFADPEDAAQALRALQTRLKVLSDQLDPGELVKDPEALRLSPWMAEWGDEQRAALVADGYMTAEEAAELQTGALWAEGYVCGVEASDEAWPEPADDDVAQARRELERMVEVLLLPTSSDEYAAHLAAYFDGREPSRDELIVDACYAVQELRLFCLDHAPRPAPRRVEATPGRNDPCPCGSGRKFKKCHGAPGA